MRSHNLAFTIVFLFLSLWSLRADASRKSVSARKVIKIEDEEVDKEHDRLFGVCSDVFEDAPLKTVKQYSKGGTFRKADKPKKIVPLSVGSASGQNSIGQTRLSDRAEPGTAMDEKFLSDQFKIDKINEIPCSALSEATEKIISSKIAAVEVAEETNFNNSVQQLKCSVHKVNIENAVSAESNYSNISKDVGSALNLNSEKISSQSPTNEEYSQSVELKTMEAQDQTVQMSDSSAEIHKCNWDLEGLEDQFDDFGFVVVIIDPSDEKECSSDSEDYDDLDGCRFEI